ncbi:MAG: DUF4352 domain-containing protein [Chloroflexota bacterium]|jgi:hypothetical protein
MRKVFVVIVALTLMLSTMYQAAHADQRCFAETGYCIDGRIREFWEQNGGLAVFGFPINNIEQTVIDGNPITYQRFERNRIELHPNNQRPYDVQLGRLGADRLTQQGRDWFTFAKSSDSGGCRVFAETGHAVCGDILKAWRSNGLQLDTNRAVSDAESLALFGMPISGVETETLGDGKQYQVQWFERARFELHPENPAPYNVLLGLLGNEDQAFRTQPTATPQPVATPKPTVSPFVPEANLNRRRGGMPRGFWTTTSDGITLAAGSFRYQSQISYWDASNAKKYVIFAITVRNDRPRGDSSVLYNNYRFTLIDLEGRSYSHASETYSMPDYQSSTDVYPGTRAGGAIAFEIPSNTAPAQIIYEYSYYAPVITLELRTYPIR